MNEWTIRGCVFGAAQELGIPARDRDSIDALEEAYRRHRRELSDGRGGIDYKRLAAIYIAEREGRLF